MTVRRRFTEHQLEPARAQPLLHDIMPIGDGALPTEVLGWREANGVLRRVRAVYPNGWTLQFSISARGTIGRVKASCRFITRVKGFAA